MRIVLIGAGNLATNLGKALFHAGHEIVQVYSRTEASAKILASVLKCTYTDTLEDVTCNADIYIVAVKDSALSVVAESLQKRLADKLVIHTAGSIPMDVLPFSRKGVFYPMQTFSKGKEVDFSVIPCFVEAETEGDVQLLKKVGLTISDTVYELNSESREYLHLAAVFCGNFANHCFSLGAQLLKQHGNIPFSVMLPLIDETAAKLYTMSPCEAQTGPAMRWDTNVMDKHLQLLASTPDLQKIYNLMSQSIHCLSNPSCSPNSSFPLTSSNS